MKKLLLLLGIAAFCTGCPGEKLGTYHQGEWWVKNMTGQAIYLDETSVAQEDSIMINLREAGYYPKKLVKFDDGVANFSSKSVYLSDELSSPVKTWNYSERDEPGKQFFNESSWDRYDKLHKDPKSTFWVFTIEPEDIAR